MQTTANTMDSGVKTLLMAEEQEFIQMEASMKENGRTARNTGQVC